MLLSLRLRLMGAYYSTRHEPTDVLHPPCGPIRGLSYVQEDGQIIDAYLGIPYAKPPIGNLRFKKPEKHDEWEDVRDCFKFGPRAPQNDELLGQFVNTVGKSEANCLTLNVFAPRTPTAQLPIMVFIHGGGFAVHSSSNYGHTTIARNLCTKGVIVVTINYRLGVLGFMSTGDDVCRGNLGLWDQTLALKWVKENAASFGGDVGNITIFGQSAGGASVDLLCLSPHSRDLFHRAIPMAGNAECFFAIRTAEQQATLTKEYARFLGWTGDENDSEDLIRFFNTQPIYKLEMGINPKKGFRHSQQGTLYFVPNYDGDFLPRPLEQLRQETPIKQIMTGTTQHEGLFFVGLGAVSRTTEGIRRFAGKIFKPCDYEEDAESVQQMTCDFYLKGIEPKNSRQLIEQIVKFVGDYSINYGTYYYANQMAKYGANVYFYSFDYHNPQGFGIFKWLLPFLGATHCTELRYLLGKGIIAKFRPNEDDMRMIDKMTTLFTNFAKYGNPNPNDNGEQVWQMHDVNHPYRHYRIELDKCAMVDDYQDRRLHFWDQIRQKNRTRSMI